MELKIHIKKKHLYLVILFTVAVALVFAQGGGVSHSVSEVVGLDIQLANFCQKDGTNCPDSPRVGMHEVTISNSNWVWDPITFSPACPDTNYRVILTTHAMEPGGQIYVPTVKSIDSSSKFVVNLFDIMQNAWTGKVKVNYLVVC